MSKATQVKCARCQSIRDASEQLFCLQCGCREYQDPEPSTSGSSLEARVKRVAFELGRVVLALAIFVAIALPFALFGERNRSAEAVEQAIEDKEMAVLQATLGKIKPNMSAKQVITTIGQPTSTRVKGSEQRLIYRNFTVVIDEFGLVKRIDR